VIGFDAGNLLKFKVKETQQFVIKSLLKQFYERVPGYKGRESVINFDFNGELARNLTFFGQFDIGAIWDVQSGIIL
jgi:hypothetical protein